RAVDAAVAWNRSQIQRDLKTEGVSVDARAAMSPLWSPSKPTPSPRLRIRSGVAEAWVTVAVCYTRRTSHSARLATLCSCWLQHDHIGFKRARPRGALERQRPR